MDPVSVAKRSQLHENQLHMRRTVTWWHNGVESLPNRCSHSETVPVSDWHPVCWNDRGKKSRRKQVKNLCFIVIRCGGIRADFNTAGSENETTEENQHRFPKHYELKKPFHKAVMRNRAFIPAHLTVVQLRARAAPHNWLIWYWTTILGDIKTRFESPRLRCGEGYIKSKSHKDLRKRGRRLFPPSPHASRVVSSRRRCHLLEKDHTPALMWRHVPSVPAAARQDSFIRAIPAHAGLTSARGAGPGPAKSAARDTRRAKVKTDRASDQKKKEKRGWRARWASRQMRSDKTWNVNLLW